MTLQPSFQDWWKNFTLNLAFSTDYISRKMKVQAKPKGSDHRPVVIGIDLVNKQNESCSFQVGTTEKLTANFPKL